jgi:hypothetical protein
LITKNKSINGTEYYTTASLPITVSPEQTLQWNTKPSIQINHTVDTQLDSGTTNHLQTTQSPIEVIQTTIDTDILVDVATHMNSFPWRTPIEPVVDILQQVDNNCNKIITKYFIDDVIEQTLWLIFRIARL